MLDVLYEDETMVAVCKPSGLLFHRGLANDDDTLVARARAYLDVASVHPLHRLDRGTSGVALLAKSPEMSAALNRAMTEGRVVKHYVALVRGVAPERLHVDHPVPAGPETKDRVDAVTDLWRIDTQPTEPRHTSWMLCAPRTGRFHQIRRHCRHISHHLIGDSKHGKGPLNRAFASGYGLERMALHALRLEVPHPTSGETIVIDAPVPDDLRVPLERMGYGVECLEAASVLNHAHAMVRSG